MTKPGKTKRPPETEQPPIFVMEPGRYYVAIWSFRLAPHLSKFRLGGDVVFMLWRFDAEPAKWHLTYRFRHNRDNKVFDSADEKHAYEQVTENADEFAVLNITQALVEMLCRAGGRGLERMMIQGDHHAFLAAIERDKSDWLHQQSEIQE